MIPLGLKHILDQIKDDPSIRLPIINLYGPPASGKTLVWNEMVEYMRPLACVHATWYGSNALWNYDLEGKVLILSELRTIPMSFSFNFVTINEQMKPPRNVPNIAHWVTEYNQPIRGALNYLIIRDEHGKADEVPGNEHDLRRDST